MTKGNAFCFYARGGSEVIEKMVFRMQLARQLLLRPCLVQIGKLELKFIIFFYF